MKQQTFLTVVRMCSDDPLTESQIAELTGEDKYKLIPQKEAARILGVTPHTMPRLPIPRVVTNSRRVQYRLHDIHKYINSHTTE